MKVLAALLLLAPALLPGPALADTVMITGANSGIGLEFARQYAAAGWTVIATHRRRQPPQTLTALAAKYPKVRIESLDVTSPEQARVLAADSPACRSTCSSTMRACTTIARLRRR